MHARAHDIVARAREYVGTPYRRKGRSKDSGVDCIGLVICVAHDLGISPYDTGAYSDRPNVREFDRLMLEAGCRMLPHVQLASGDIVRLAMPRWPVHCAVYEEAADGSRWIVHAYLPHRKVTRDPLTPARESQVSSTWRYPV